MPIMKSVARYGSGMSTGRIVLFGATGFTGRLTARALVQRGARPVLAGRDRARLEELAASLSVELPTIVDRKSTRLNSSHVKISYAVFCLKKKKHQIML